MENITTTIKQVYNYSYHVLSQGNFSLTHKNLRS